MNFGQKALQVLRTVAPTIATAALGPFGPIAGAAISAALGTPAGDQKAAEAALVAATPDQLLALKNAEADFQEKMRQLGIDEEKMVYDDIANARAREIAVKDLTPRILAYVVVAFTLVLEGYVLVQGLPKSAVAADAQQLATVIGRVLGTLDTATALVLSYYFGSSAGSASKTDALNTIAVAK